MSPFCSTSNLEIVIAEDTAYGASYGALDDDLDVDEDDVLGTYELPHSDAKSSRFGVAIAIKLCLSGG